MRLEELKIDVKVLEEGEWVKNIPELEDVSLKVRGMNNKDYRKLERRLIETLPRKRRMNGRVEVEDQEKITNTCLLQTVLLDWNGLTNGSNEPVPYSREMAEQLISDPQYRRFRDAVIWAATVVVEQQKDEQEDIAKN